MNILKLSDLSVKEINEILDLANDYKTGKINKNYNHKIIANLFFEPSTRTHYSFDTAALRLGCKTINFDTSNSSLKKGETLYDTVKTFEMFGVNALVIRATENEYYNDLIPSIKIPIINAGDGTGNHPSQSLLDLFTIKEEFGNFEGLNITIIGDIKHSRVAHSNIDVMKRLGMNVYVSGPIEYKEEKYDYITLDEALEKSDIIMLLRIQNERHDKLMSMSNEEYNKLYGLDMNKVNKMKEHAIIMHPAPFNRNVELTDDVVECSKSRIFKQIENGVFVRMALIDIALSK